MPSFADRLAHTLQAHRDFTQALAIVGSIRDDYPRAQALIHIGKAQVRSGIDPSQSFNGLNQLAERQGQLYHQVIYKGIAEIHIEAGDFESAQKVLNQAPHLLQEHRFYLELAIAKAKHGQDPLPELSKVRAEIEEDEAKYLSGGTDSYAELAEVHYQATGEYPQAYLAKAESNLEAYAKAYPDEINLPVWYGNLARAYARVGNFDKARALVDKIKVLNPIFEAQTRMQAIGHIAQGQVARGLCPDAIANAQLAIQTIEQAEVSPGFLREHLQHDQTVGVIKLLALIAKAKGLAGEDSSDTFSLALERVGQIQDNGYWKMHVLIAIARAQKDIGIDTASTLARALDEIDAMPEASDFDSYYDLSRLIMGYVELAEVQIDFGQIDEARAILNRLESLKTSDSDSDMEDIEGIIAELLADIAEAEARQGLSPDELRQIPKQNC